MSVHPKTGSRSEKKNVSIPLAVVCVAALVAFMVWWGIKNFGPEPMIITEAGRIKEAWMDKIARESKGDFSKLSLADQGELQKYSWGHGEIALKGHYKNMGGN